MSAAEKPIQFDEFLANAPAIFERMEREQTGVLVERAGTVYALRPKAKRARRPKHFTERDSLFRLAGIGHSAEPTNIAEHKHDYLADAFDDRQRP